MMSPQSMAQAWLLDAAGKSLSWDKSVESLAALIIAAEARGLERGAAQCREIAESHDMLAELSKDHAADYKTHCDAAWAARICLQAIRALKVSP